MPAKKNSAKPPKSVETLRHDDAKRKNIPTAEHQSVLKPDDASPRPLKYPRNTDLDPQLVWRGKDEQDWSDLVVHAPPLYIQEKVHPKVLIDDLLSQTKATKSQTPGFQTNTPASRSRSKPSATPGATASTATSRTSATASPSPAISSPIPAPSSCRSAMKMSTAFGR